MNLSVFPSSRRPYYYFSNSDEVVWYFIENFLYFRTLLPQFSINVFKIAVPKSLQLILLKKLFRKQKDLPQEMFLAVTHTIDYIKSNKRLFMDKFESCDHILFIVRNSKWERNVDKFVLILFKDNDSRPFAIAKVGLIESKGLFIEEFEKAERVYNNFESNQEVSVPKPIAFFASEKIAGYFENCIPGVPFNDYLKRFFRKNRKRVLYIDVMEKCTRVLISMGCNNELLNEKDFSQYFYKPLEDFHKSTLGINHESELLKIKSGIESIEKDTLNSVWMHGDFWTGSILYDKSNIGVIDWEFFLGKGVPFWDFFSLVFHIGADFNYFTDPKITQKIDSLLLELAASYKIDKNNIPILFQSYLLFNVHFRDTTDKYWLNSLTHYWKMSHSRRDNDTRLL